jgi:hypothetical protein
MKIFFGLLLVSNLAFANDAAILRCRAIAEAAPRLACYDAMEVAVKGDVIAKKEAGVQKPAPAIPVAPTANAPVAKTEVEKFGLIDKTAKKDELDVIESSIAGSFEGWEATTLFRLTNGQVWRVADDSARPHYVENPKIRITRGAFGAFYMEIQGTKIAPRVKRVQ